MCSKGLCSRMPCWDKLCVLEGCIGEGICSRLLCWEAMCSRGLFGEAMCSRLLCWGAICRRKSCLGGWLRFGGCIL